MILAKFEQLYMVSGFAIAKTQLIPCKADRPGLEPNQVYPAVRVH